MRVATATYTVGTARATGRNTREVEVGLASAGLLPNTNSRIRPERWASNASAPSIGDSGPTDSREGLTAADSVAVATGAAVSTAEVRTGGEATGVKCRRRCTAQHPSS